MIEVVCCLIYGAFESENLSPSVIAKSVQNVSFSIKIEGKVISISACYASTKYIVRRNLWSELDSLQHTYKAPWCFIGDFNCVRFS